MRRLVKRLVRGSGSNRSRDDQRPPREGPPNGREEPSNGRKEPPREQQELPREREEPQTSPPPQTQQQHQEQELNSGLLASEPGGYQYRPLNSPSSFRILHLRRLASDSDTTYDRLQLSGTMIEATFDSHPDYFALSYCWGDPTPCDQIEIDDQILRITKSCGSALRRMMKGKLERVIWVDSICINQAEDLAALIERGQQVTMMDQIYRNAEQVNVYLGEGDAATDVACQALKSLKEMYLGAKMPGPEQEAWRQKYEELVDDVLENTNEFPFGKLYGLFRLPWFKRSWVIQEVALGRKVMFYCGFHLMHLKTIVIGADFSRLPYSKLYSNQASYHWRSYLDYHDAMNEFIRRKEEGEPISNFGLTLGTVLMGPAFQCVATRPEDKIYSLYGMCKRFGFELPKPDYQKPVGLIYTEAAAAIIQDEKGLDLLSSVTESSGWWEFDLPSWVPNFSGSAGTWSADNPPCKAIGVPSKTRASGTSSYEYYLEPGATRLIVKGRRLGVVLGVGDTWVMDATSTVLGNANLPTGQYISNLMTSLETWYDIAREAHPGDENGTIALNSLVRTLMLTRDEKRRQASTSLPFQVIHACVCILLNAAKTVKSQQPRVMPLVLKFPTDNFVEIRTLGHFFISNTMLYAIQEISNASWMTVLRTSSTRLNEMGHLGVGTHTVRPDDVVVVIAGSPAAAVLRSYQDGYRYIGPATVDGIMDGEFWETGTEADDELFVLI